MMLWQAGYDATKTDYLVQGFKHGFDLGYRGPLIRQHTSNNLPLTVGTKTDLWEKVMKEVKLGRAVGPFSHIPFHYYVQSPIGLVPKAGGQTRMIFHLSYDFGKQNCNKSVNFHTPDYFCSVHYHDLDYAVRTCLKLIQWRLPAATKTFFSRSDLKSAFRTVPILPAQRWLLIFKAMDPTTNEVKYFVDRMLPFGASSSCTIYQRFSDSLKFLLEHHSGCQFSVTNYLDDYLCIHYCEQGANYLVRKFLEICSKIGCPVALEKTEYASTHCVFLGMLLDGVNHRIIVPEEKRIKALNLIRWVCERKKVTIVIVQRLTGVLNFLTKAIVPGRTFTRAMYDKLKLCDNKGRLLREYHHMSLGSEFLQDCGMWEAFLTCAGTVKMNLCRPFVDLDKVRHSATLRFFSDASKNSSLGFSAVYKNKYWFAHRWPVGFIERYDPSIQFLELYALVAAVLTWGSKKELTNARVTIFCDNKSVRDMVNSQISTKKDCMKLLRLLVLNNIEHNRRLFVEYVESARNDLADVLSRLKFSEFWRIAPDTMNRTPDQVAASVWPVNMLWQ